MAAAIAIRSFGGCTIPTYVDVVIFFSLLLLLLIFLFVLHTFCSSKCTLLSDSDQPTDCIHTAE